MRALGKWVLAVLLWASAASGQPASSWREAKTLAASVYADHTETFYCGCGYRGRSIELSECPYQPRAKWRKRSFRLEWEHVVPASVLAGALPCWTEGHPRCAEKGRACCQKVDEEAQERIFDLHNLVPAIGQVNAYRSDYVYGEVEEPSESFEGCSALVSRARELFEPPDSVKGDTARIWLYMTWKYGIGLSPEERRTFLEWHWADPPDAWELERNRRIRALQGDGNLFVE